MHLLLSGTEPLFREGQGGQRHGHGDDAALHGPVGHGRSAQHVHAVDAPVDLSPARGHLQVAQRHHKGLLIPLLGRPTHHSDEVPGGLSVPRRADHLGQGDKRQYRRQHLPEPGAAHLALRVLLRRPPREQGPCSPGAEDGEERLVAALRWAGRGHLWRSLHPCAGGSPPAGAHSQRGGAWGMLAEDALPVTPVPSRARSARSHPPGEHTSLSWHSWGTFVPSTGHPDARSEPQRPAFPQGAAQQGHRAPVVPPPQPLHVAPVPRALCGRHGPVPRLHMDGGARADCGGPGGEGDGAGGAHAQRVDAAVWEKMRGRRPRTHRRGGADWAQCGAQRSLWDGVWVPLGGASRRGLRQEATRQSLGSVQGTWPAGGASRAGGRRIWRRG
mmetsp:Transcript_46224/g.115935  ORF Transcript_46224/g.115935 Transcript_46224/m.115935 type:complete len:386 (+) Transcript_46224:190-1347(+)